MVAIVSPLTVGKAMCQQKGTPVAVVPKAAGDAGKHGNECSVKSVLKENRQVEAPCPQFTGKP